MVKTKYLVAALLIVMVGILATLLFFPSEEKKVKKRFAHLSEQLSKDPGENTFIMANKIKGISALFGENCIFTVPDYSLSGNYTREEISGIALRGRAHFSTLGLKFSDLKRTKATDVLRDQDALGETDEPIAVDGACVFQAFRFPD